MSSNFGFLEAIFDDCEPIENCFKCGKKALIRSYGGESGDYCFDCHFEMVERINSAK